MQFGLLGRRLGHSYSPEIHRALGAESYSLIELEPEDVAGFLERRQFQGINVTIPYKMAVMEHLDEISGEAVAIGSVNTVVNRDGRLFGYNTDIDGFMHMVGSAGIVFQGRKVLILGTGGTSRTAACGAKRLGARSVTHISRSGEDNYSNLSRHSDAEIIVNTTPVGMYPNCPASPLDLELFPGLCGVADVVYNPCRTGLMLQAERLGVPCVSGLSMLVWQAKRARELFTGAPISDAAALAVLSALRRREENIVLIGMPGSGKTTVARILSRMTGRLWYDADRLISEKAGMSIPEIFAREGETGFRARETGVLGELGKQSGVIIACGGGAVTRPENYPLLHQNGRIYEISRPLESLATAGRPLSRDRAALENMQKVRRPMYEAFRDALIPNTRTPERAAEAVWAEFSDRRNIT
ncbi:MAG: shikimate kinase [Oscillospiraceae bacterium]|nr:shikimate kinase [Oscillospiraceae bacterium]